MLVIQERGGRPHGVLILWRQLAPGRALSVVRSTRLLLPHSPGALPRFIVCGARGAGPGGWAGPLFVGCLGAVGELGGGVALLVVRVPVHLVVLVLVLVGGQQQSQLVAAWWVAPSMARMNTCSGPLQGMLRAGRCSSGACFRQGPAGCRTRGRASLAGRQRRLAGHADLVSN